MNQRAECSFLYVNQKTEIKIRQTKCIVQWNVMKFCGTHLPHKTTQKKLKAMINASVSYI